jgi:hypothetical protein
MTYVALRIKVRQFGEASHPCLRQGLLHYALDRLMPARLSSPASPAQQFAGFLAKFSPDVRSVATAALAKMRKRLPGAIEIVYDNYYALVVGFGPSERPSDAIFSLAIYPRHVTLCFLYGVELDDPERLLAGGGNQVRHIRLASASDLDRPAIKSLMTQAVNGAETPFDTRARRRMIIRMISKNPRSRRPPEGKTSAKAAKAAK